MSPRLGYKQTAEHLRNRFPKTKQSTTRKKTTKKEAPSYQVVVDPYLVDMANTDTLDTLSTQPKMDFDAACAYLKRFDTIPDAQLTPEERFIKRMGQKG